MKNIYFYIYPERQFASEYTLMAKSQIDNSLLYWQPEDILVVTNFDWEYRGVKAHVVGDELTAQVVSHGTSLSNKLLTAIYLIEHKLVDSFNWFHDWDIYQLSPLGLTDLDRDLGLVEYSYKPRIQLGSLFFKPQGLDMLKLMSEAVNEHKVNEEEAVNIVITKNQSGILDRIRLLDVSYNVSMRNLDAARQVADKPLKIAHFPPYQPKYLHKSKQVTSPALQQILEVHFSPTPRIKNMLVYISPYKRLNPEHELMLEVQIDNSLQFWAREDLIVLTNFPYEYNGVQAIEVPDSLINKSFETNKRGIINSKVDAMIYAIETGIVDGLTWFHDFDSFQLAELDLPDIEKDMGIVCYGLYPESRLTNLGRKYEHRVNFGNVFIKPASLEILKTLLAKMDQTGLYEEDAMTLLLADETSNIASRVQIMDQTYNIGMRYVRSNIAIAEKPLRVAHFPPNDPRALAKFKNILPAKLSQLLTHKFEGRL